MNYPQRTVLQGVEAQLFKLVSSSSTPEQWEEWLRVPLEHAAARGDVALVTRLLKAGGNGRSGRKGCRGRTLLDAAALGGSADVVSALLQAGARPDVNVISAYSGRSALYVATSCGHEGAARQLLVAGADVNFVDPTHKCGLLHAAASRGYVDLTTDLLIGGASPNALNEQGRTPLHVAAALGRDKIVSLLLRTAANKNAVTYEEEDSVSALMEASWAGHLSSVEILLDAGVDKGSRSFGEGYAALDMAVRRGHVDIARAILKKGADVNAACSFGYAALHAAAEYSGAGSVGVLLDAEADVNLKTNGGMTPLSIATRRASTEVVLALLQGGGNVNDTNRDGDTPLHEVCRKQREGTAEVVDLLLRWGASERAVNNDFGNQTPADLLLVRRHEEGSCSTGEVERARVLLARARADRSWRRRCWLVMLRSRAATREAGTQRGGDGSSGGGTEGDGRMVSGGDGEDGGAKGRRVNDNAKSTRGGRRESVGDVERETFREERLMSGLVTGLLGLESHHLFRMIVGYL